MDPHYGLFGQNGNVESHGDDHMVIDENFLPCESQNLQTNDQRAL